MQSGKIKRPNRTLQLKIITGTCHCQGHSFSLFCFLFPINDNTKTLSLGLKNRKTLFFFSLPLRSLQRNTVSLRAKVKKIKKKSQFSPKTEINDEKTEGGGSGGAFAGPPPVRAHRRPAMAVPAESEGKPEAVRDSLPPRSPSAVQGEGSGVLEASPEAQDERRGA